ncbi:MAG: putative beta-lysine N-acetyltransferase [Leptospirales bacterium]|jgi:putative beta-lysine N-acetyltransferase
MPDKKADHQAPAAAAGEGEWDRTGPTDKGMGLVELTLDRGTRTTIIGQVYGLDYEIEGQGFRFSVYFDYYNRRLKVEDYEAGPARYRAMIERLLFLADENDFDRILLKAREDDWRRFLKRGFVLEGQIKNYFHGADAFVLGRFSSEERLNSPAQVEENRTIEKIQGDARNADYQAPALPEGYRVVPATEAYIPKMVQLYRRVFRTYPTPLSHPDYLQQTMRGHVIYRLILNAKGDLVCAASAEMNAEHSNAELTDCATRASDRGKGLMFHLLTRVEADLRERGIATGYTMARAASGGMNAVFYRMGYEYGGRLVNSCDIGGGYENMNIWYKDLAGTT